MSEDDAAQAALGEPEPNDIPRRCEALNEYSEQCIYGAVIRASLDHITVRVQLGAGCGASCSGGAR
jgi:hypothetical protein